jgi:hypothetical protein
MSLRNEVFRSQVIDILGAASFAEFSAVRHPGTVVWCNFDLACEFGFDVPPTQIKTIDGVTYSIKAWNDRYQTRRLRVGELEFEPPCLIGRFKGYTFAIPDRHDLQRMI